MKQTVTEEMTEDMKPKSKLTRKQSETLLTVLGHLERARSYIHAADVAVAKRGTFASTTLHYVRVSDGSTLYEVERAIGSDLCGLDTGIEDLRTFIGL